MKKPGKILGGICAGVLGLLPYRISRKSPENEK